MKQFLFLLGASSLFVVAGCSMPWQQEENSVSMKEAEKTATENPEELFYSLVKASGAEFQKTLDKHIPDREILVKNESDISITGDFNLAGTPFGAALGGGGTGSFDLSMKGAVDYSDSTNPIMHQTIDIFVSALGELVKVDGVAEFRVVENSIFTVIQELEFNIPETPPEFAQIAQKFVGQWYGNTFAEIEAMVEETEEAFDINTMLVGGSVMMEEVLDLTDDITQNPENHITFNEYIESKDGYYYFSATPKKETVMRVVEIISTGLYGSLEDSMLEEVKADIEAMELSPVVVAYTPENPKYFIVQKETGDINANATVNKKGVNISFESTNESGENLGFTWNRESGEMAVTAKESGAENPTTYVSGNYTKEALSFSVFVPLQPGLVENPEKVADASFTKEGKKWNGEITSPLVPGGKIIVTDAYANTEEGSASIQAMMEENTVLTLNLKSSAKKPDTITVEKPENSKSFEVLGQEIEVEFNALNQSIPGEEDITDVSPPQAPEKVPAPPQNTQTLPQ